MFPALCDFVIEFVILQNKISELECNNKHLTGNQDHLYNNSLGPLNRKLNTSALQINLCRLPKTQQDVNDLKLWRTHYVWYRCIQEVQHVIW